MVVGGSQQETLDTSFVLLGICRQGVPVVLSKPCRQHIGFQDILC
ncbi:unnamed protein product [Schistosoma margrebowiei]|uniref:Uncharacterized protein n=1 Tax=Schistosoma margrebowiei TaxID=48269 RepID=A0A183N6M1_9TREM|nr:unnamed protein product [Schistosoma margrebowiei]